MFTLLHTALLLLHIPVAADSVARDTLRQPVVVITAWPWQWNVRQDQQSKLAFSRSELVALAPFQARDVLSLVPGVFVRDYGGSSALQTVSLRGGSSSQALVLIDGARLSSAQSGSADISMIPMRYVSSVDVTRGGASALYGANALNGVVEMRLRLPISDGVRVAAMGGSFDQWALSAGATQHIGRIAVGADVDRLGSMGSFPFTTSQFGSVYEVNRQNNDVRSTRALLRIEDPGAYSATVLARSVDRGVPGAVVQGNITQARARLRDDDIMGNWSVALGAPSASAWKWVGSLRCLDQAFSDPDATLIGTQGIDVRYIQRDVTQSILTQHHDVLNAREGSLHLGARFDVSYADIRGKSLQGADGTIYRGSVGATADAQFEGASSLIPSVRAALRTEYFTDIGLVVSPLVGMNVPLNESITLRTLWSYNVRPPSFNELYYLNYGTKDLRPERSHTFEVGCHVRPAPWIDIDATGYYINTADLIVSVPVSPVIMSAQNVGAARTFGMELVARATAFSERMRMQYSYAYMQALDATGRAYLDGTMLPYAPPETISGLVMWNEQVWFCSATFSYTSYRYHSTGNVYSSLLQPFTLVGVQGGIRVQGARTHADIRVQCDNLFDETYEVVKGYPMPGRTIRLVTSVEFGR